MLINWKLVALQAVVVVASLFVMNVATANEAATLGNHHSADQSVSAAMTTPRKSNQ